MRKIVLVCLAAYFLFPQLANAQSGCTGQAQAGTVCGNNTTSQGLPTFKTNPVLGVPGSITGQLGFGGSTSGTATIVPQATTGSPTLTLPNTTGTLASNVTSPIVLSATTGNISLQGASGTIAQGSGGTGSTFTATPTLGTAGSVVGTVGFQNATSGTITISPPTGALGTVTNTFQAVTDTFVYRTTTDTLTNKTLTSPTINSGALSGTFTGNATLSGNITFSGQLIETGTTFPASAAGQTVLLGSTSSSATLTNTGQAVFYNTNGAGAVVQGDGSTYDICLNNKGGTAASCVPTGTQNTIFNGTVTITSNSASSLIVGPNGTTNPVLKVDDSVASQATGVLIQGQAAGNGTVIAAQSSGTNENLTIISKGNASLTLNNTNTGTVAIGNSTGGVTTNGTITATVNSTTGLTIGPNGSTNPTLTVNTAGASGATGFAINNAAAGSGAALVVTSSATNDNATIQSKGTGNLALNGTIVNIGNQNVAGGTINLGSGSGGITVNIGSANNGVNAFNVFTGGGSSQTWVSGGGATTITMPATTTTLAGLAVAETFTATQTFTGAVNATSPPASSAANQYVFTVATGTAAMGTSAIASGACATVVTVSATGTATTDVIDVGFNADPTAATGFIAPNMLTIIPYPTSNNVNFKECNNTAASITPAALTINWRVRR